jgi:NAD-dependent deacetylase sirtuin 4
MLNNNAFVLVLQRSLISTPARAYTRHNLPKHSLKFVPKSNPATGEDIEKIQEFVLNKKRLFIITGAGLSTESGIPDYRSEGVGLYARSASRPIEHSDFMKHAHKRQSYWARNYVSWPIFSSFEPNQSHHILGDWEKRGKAHYHVTQNVDSLLVKAGCRKLTELHGTSYKVKCMDCDTRFTRDAVQLIIQAQNKHWHTIGDFELSADNDVLLTEEQIRDFKTPICPKCNKDRLKPEVGEY